jgi:dihydrofolate synthase/folylpolyglutamate synthase
MQQTMNYHEALNYIYGFTDYEKRGLAIYAPEFYDLARVRHLLALLGAPQQSFQVVHIAGTKGKGSTAAMVESVLRAAGYRTGLYTSPHLHTFRERIQVSGAYISEADIVRLVLETQPLVAQVPDITTFEVMTCLACLWFAEQGVEWAVLEVGLGGRLDATNVVTPAVAVITSLSLDHTGILGHTLAQIATEKAGIVKPGIPTVSAPQPEQALAVLEATCERQGSPLTLVGRDWSWVLDHADLEGQSFTICHGQEALPGLWLPLLGEHQVLNATTAVAALAILQQNEVTIPQAAIYQGLRTVQWPGRLEVLGRTPFVVADCAHNGDSARRLVDALKTYFPFKRLTVVLGASPDHATPEFLETLLSDADRSIVTRSRHPRAAAPTQLQARAERLGFHPDMSPTVAEALDLALRDATPEDLVCCTGSVFVAAEARVAWFVRQGLPVPCTDPA